MIDAHSTIHIEHIVHQEGRTYVVPFDLPSPNPRLRVGMTLSGVPIDPWFTEIEIDGERRSAFIISPKARPHSLEVGQAVTLEDGRWNAKRVWRELRRVKQHEWPRSVRKAIVAGIVLAVMYTLTAVSGLMWAMVRGLDPAEFGGLNPVLVVGVAIFLYFALALSLGTVVGFVMPFVRDRETARLLGAVVGIVALLTFVPLLRIVDPDSGGISGVVSVVIVGAFLGVAAASAVWDEHEGASAADKT